MLIVLCTVGYLAWRRARITPEIWLIALYTAAFILSVAFVSVIFGDGHLLSARERHSLFGSKIKINLGHEGVLIFCESAHYSRHLAFDPVNCANPAADCFRRF